MNTKILHIAEQEDPMEKVNERLTPEKYFSATIMNIEFSVLLP